MRYFQVLRAVVLTVAFATAWLAAGPARSAGLPSAIAAGGFDSPAIPAQCGDGIDNDGDGLVDFPNDPGCSQFNDPSEKFLFLICDDGLDNDGDGLVDYPNDPGCDSPIDPGEKSPTLACDDDIDDDGDGLIDYPEDLGCTFVDSPP